MGKLAGPSAICSAAIWKISILKLSGFGNSERSRVGVSVADTVGATSAAGSVAEITGVALVTSMVACSWLLPGLVDVHTHLRVPGGEHKEDFPRAQPPRWPAASRMILAMPNTSPPLSTPEVLAAARAHRRPDILLRCGPLCRGQPGRWMTNCRAGRARRGAEDLPQRHLWPAARRGPAHPGRLLPPLAAPQADRPARRGAERGRGHRPGRGLRPARSLLPHQPP
jgi:hypothetical protein